MKTSVLSRWGLAAAAAFGFACMAAGGEAEVVKKKEEPKPAAETAADETTANERATNALKTQFADAAAHEAPLSDFLALLAKMTDTNIVLDPSLPDDVKKTSVSIRVRKGTTASEALGVALAISGLRYILADGAVFISTPGKLSDRLIYGDRPAKPLGAERASSPMTVSEAVVLTSDLNDDDGFVPIDMAIRHTPWRVRRLPWRDPATGLMQYPAPPIWQEDPDVGSPRFRFSHQPSFLKPEYLAEFVYGQRQQQQSADAEVLSAVLKLMKDNPNLTSEEVLQKLGMGSKKAAKAEK